MAFGAFGVHVITTTCGFDLGGGGAPSAVLYVAAVARVAARPAIALSVAVVAQLPREMQVDVALRMAFSEQGASAFARSLLSLKAI